jgi:hypothetical protein
VGPKADVDVMNKEKAVVLTGNRKPVVQLNPATDKQ